MSKTHTIVIGLATALVVLGLAAPPPVYPQSSVQLSANGHFVNGVIEVGEPVTLTATGVATGPVRHVQIQGRRLQPSWSVLQTCSSLPCQVSVHSNIPGNFRFRAVVSLASNDSPLTVTYEMPRRVGKLHNPPTEDDINPKSWPVLFQVQRCAATDKYEWTVSGTPQAYERRGPCLFELRFPKLGVYPVQVTATPTSGGSPRVGMLEANVKDWLIVGLGDSLSSGESVPDTPAGTLHREVWKDRRCHRSDAAYQALAANRIEARSKQASVTLLHLACSGARIPNGLLGGFEGIEPADPKNPIPPQLLVTKQLIGSRHVDALLLSIGVNDLNFGQVVAFCWTWTNCPNRHWQGISGPRLRELIPRWLNELWPRYGNLNRTLQYLGIGARDVYLLEYPDPLHHNGAICRTGVKGVGISPEDAQWLFDNMVLPLNAMVHRAAGEYDWNLVRGAQARFAPHGYCAPTGERWITTYNESGDRQNNRNGTLHPNYTGHAVLAGQVFDILSSRLQGNPASSRPGTTIAGAQSSPSTGSEVPSAEIQVTWGTVGTPVPGAAKPTQLIVQALGVTVTATLSWGADGRPRVVGCPVVPPSGVVGCTGPNTNPVKMDQAVTITARLNAPLPNPWALWLSVDGDWSGGARDLPVEGLVHCGPASQQCSVTRGPNPWTGNPPWAHSNPNDSNNPANLNYPKLSAASSVAGAFLCRGPGFTNCWPVDALGRPQFGSAALGIQWIK